MADSGGLAGGLWRTLADSWRTRKHLADLADLADFLADLAASGGLAWRTLADLADFASEPGLVGFEHLRRVTFSPSVLDPSPWEVSPF